jgi:hypothetical protein
MSIFFFFFCLSLHYSMFVSKFQTNLFESDATQRNQLNHIVLYVVQLQLTPGGVCRSLQKTTHFIAYSTRKKNFPGFLAFYYRGRKRMLVRGLVGINCSSKCKNDADFTNGNHTWYQQKKEKKNFEIISANPSICFLQEQLQRSYDISPSFFSSPAINIRPSFSYLW